MNDEFENALAWFRSAPTEWIESAKKDLGACAEWIWEVIQGDFNDNASTAQVVTGTVISMIPFVDQLCDVRDVVANCKKIDEEPDHSWHWVSLVLTLIGLFPTLGSLVKGCGKVLFAYMRKAGAASGASPEMARCLEVSISQLNKFLARPEVIKTLKALKIDNPYKYLAKEIRTIARKLNTAALLRAFDQAKDAAGSILNLVRKWGGTGLAEQTGELLETIDQVRRRADGMLAKAIKPVQNYLIRLARQLEIDADMAHRANLNAVNPHAFTKVSLAAEEAAFNKAKPAWVDNTGKLVYRPIQRAQKPKAGWTSTRRDPKRGRHPLDDAHKTFHTLDQVIIPPGTTLYRVVDPTSSDNSICWMTKAEFDKLKTKDDWRRRFAVWANWNSNGEFITYSVPPGPGLKVWEGITASQKMDGTNYVLEGGARQIVIDPAHLEKAHMGPRQKTGWGYGDLGATISLVGVPIQKNNWYEKGKP
jgi:hypothetical protein